MAADLGTHPASRSSPAAAGGFLHPERITSYLDLRPGMIVADFGAGSGYFTIPAARRVGAEGKVYAIDIQPQALGVIRSKAALEHLLQVETVWADLERPRGSHLPDGAVDFVVIANILFQAEDKAALLAEAGRVLRPGGRMAILEWDEASFPAGPPAGLRVAKASAKRLAASAGFEPDKEFEAGSHHYGLLFRKQ